MRPPYFTLHAQGRMKLYRVSQAEVMQVLAQPDHTTPTEQGRLNAWKLFGRGWLRVTYIDEGERRVIITVTPRRKGPGGS